LHIFILAIVLGLAALAAVLMPRPIQRTAALAWFSCIIFYSLDITEPAVALCVLSCLLGVIDLLFFREPNSLDLIGDKQTASSTLEIDIEISGAARLIPDWKEVLKHAWSVRLMILDALLSGAEVALPLLNGLLPVSPGVFAGLSFLVVVAAFVARFVAQSKLSGGKTDPDYETGD